MTNIERILAITDRDKSKRIRKILSCIHKNYDLQVANPTDPTFPTYRDITNIIIPAKDQTNKTTIMAHHDVFPGSNGYNDNSTGVVTLLKLQDDLRDHIELVFTDGEECGGQGCRYYLEHSIKPKEALNIDVVGLGNKIFYETYGGDKKVPFRIPDGLELYEDIPFSDSYVLASYGIPNILLLTGKSHNSLIKNIFEAQHCGKNDSDLTLISENVMNDVYDTIRTMIG